MRKWVMAALMMLFLLPLSACDYHELDNMVFTAGMGIERMENGDYQVSMEIIAMEKGSQENYKPQIAVATGKTVLEATTNVRGLIAQRLDFSHCKVILLDEALAKEGIAHVVDALFLYNEIDISTLCMVTVDCTPLQVLSTEALTSRAQGFGLRSTIIDEMGVEKATRSSLLWLYNSIHDVEGLAVLPRITRPMVGDRAAIDIDGGVVVYQGKARGELDRREMLFFLLGEDSPHDRMLSVPFGEGFFSAKIEVSRSSIGISVVQGTVEVSIRVKTKINFVGDYGENSTLDEVSAHIEAYLKDGIEKTIEKARDEMDCDLYKIAMKLYRTYPGVFADASGWRDHVRSARYDVQVEIEIQADDILKRRQ